MNARGIYTTFRTLVGLPALVRKQRQLEAKLGDDKGSFVDQEKAVRDEIDLLFVELKFASGDGVTCNGYDVVHRERKGREAIDVPTLIVELGAFGVTPEQAQFAITAATKRGDPSHGAEVNPSKGAKVRR